jgi:hypothetical protein
MSADPRRAEIVATTQPIQATQSLAVFPSPRRRTNRIEAGREAPRATAA